MYIYNFNQKINFTKHYFSRYIYTLHSKVFYRKKHISRKRKINFEVRNFEELE